MQLTLKTIGLVLLLVVFGGCSHSFVSAQGDEKNAPLLSGVWQTVVTPRICATGNPVGPTFPGILLFDQDGTMTGTSTAVSSVYGLWNRDAGRSQYSFASLSLKYDASGNLVGSRRISQNVTVDDSGDSFTSTGTFQDYDISGNSTISGCATATGTRFK